MNCRLLLPYLITILLLAPSLADMCQSVRCPKGSRCIQGNCQEFLDTLYLISLYNTTNKKCDSKICKIGEDCVNNTCLLVNTVRPRAYPPKPSQPWVLRRAISPYGTNYCEQNVYFLCQQFAIIKKQGAQGFAVIVRSKTKSTYIRWQWLGQGINFTYRWNYHVFFIQKDGNDVRVYDYDSRLRWGVRFQQAWDKIFKPQTDLDRTNALWFRVFEYQHYLKYFSKPRGPYVEGNPKKLKNTPPTTDEIKSNIDKRGNGFNYMVSFGNHPNMERYTPQWLSTDKFYEKMTNRKP